MFLLKDDKIGDEVITHLNRYRTVVNKQRKLKECVSIKLSDGTEILQPETHRYYVFNRESKKFYFKEVGKINKEKESLVKSNLSNFIGTFEVVDKIKDDNNPEYPIVILLDNGDFYQSSLNHEYCVYEGGNFIMKKSKEVEKGDLFCVFDWESRLLS